METTFKRAEMSDLEIIMEFIREFYEFDHHPFEYSSVHLTLTKIVNDDSLGRVWLIQQSQEAIGYIILTFGFSLEYRGRDAFIDEFYVREDYRGQGVGTNTLQFVEEVCPSLNIQALHLEVERDNTVAQGFYRKVGFRDQNRYLMTKWLTS